MSDVSDSKTRNDTAGRLSRRRFVGASVAAATPLGLGALFAPNAEAGSDHASSREARTANDIGLGVIFGLTGPGAFVSQAGKQGVTLALEDLRNGLLGGRPLSASYQDSTGDPTKAVTLLRQFASNGTKLIIGPQTSNSVLAAIPVSKQLKTVCVTSMSTNPSITGMLGAGGNPYMFRVNPPDDALARALVRLAVTQLKDKRLSVVARNDDLGRGAAAAFKAAAKKYHASIISTDYFQVGGSYDFSSTLTRLKAKKPQAIIFVGTIEEGIPFARQKYEQRVNARLYTRGVSITTDLYQKLGPKIVNGLHAVEPYFAEISEPLNRQFVAKWRKRFKSDPINQGYFTYAGTHMLAQAIVAAQSTNPDAVAQAMKDVVYPGVTGILQFDAHNQTHPNVYVGRVACSGRNCRVQVIAQAVS